MSTQRSRRSSVAAALLLLLPAIPAAAAPGTSEPVILKPAQSESRQPGHRDRAVTEEDYRELAPSSPGTDVHRPQAPAPAAAPGRDTKALDPPVIDDRSFKQLREETRRRVPAHTPEWTDHNDGDPGATGLDAEAGQLHFGDGEYGRRPPSGKTKPNPEYRRGTAADKKLPAPPAPVPLPYPGGAKADLSGSSDDDND